jgi:hypothetical protein
VLKLGQVALVSKNTTGPASGLAGVVPPETTIHPDNRSTRSPSPSLPHRAFPRYCLSPTFAHYRTRYHLFVLSSVERIAPHISLGVFFAVHKLAATAHTPATQHHNPRTARHDGLRRLLDDMHKGGHPIMRPRGPPGDQWRRRHTTKLLLEDD